MFLKRNNIKQQLKTHSVAIVSLITALCGFFYNTWQGQQDEIHQNMRNAAFEVLKDLGELQAVVNYAHYEPENPKGNPIEGWKYVILVRDLSRLLPVSAMQNSQTLYVVWERDWETLRTSQKSETEISLQIAKARVDTLKIIDSLN